MISSLFLRFAIIFAIVGMALGIYMGVAQDHSLTPVHAHINLVGWVSMFLAGLFYRAIPNAKRNWRGYISACRLSASCSWRRAWPQ